MNQKARIENYNEEWPVWFEKIKSFIKSVLGSLAIRIEHVGSTSIRGMVAKPIIDLDVVINRKNLEKVKSLLADVGYEHEGDLGIKGREAFKIINTDLETMLPPHHLYVCDFQNDELYRHIAFREYLRFHLDDMKRYSDLKIALVREFEGDLEQYIDRKSVLVNQILERALRWYKESNS